MKTALVFVLSFPLFCFASIPNSKITSEIDSKLKNISTAQSWKEFVKEHPQLFPPIKKDGGTFVTVDRMPLQIDGESIVLGVGYRQTFIKAKLDRVKKVLNNPSLFKSLYGLTRDADLGVAKINSDESSFQARIYKKVPVIPNQDYVLSYSNSKDGSIWFQRAKMVEDHENFAIRDNLKTIEEFEDGVILREVSMVYVLKWWVRFFGPQMREVMTKELRKITDSMRCLSEGSDEPTNSAASACWEKAQASK